jgi:predicted RNA-binding protein YlqC (UPF0109 family)
MEEFLRYVVQGLAEHPEEALIDRVEKEGGTAYLLSLQGGDAGRLIGRNGATIQAIRTLVTAASKGVREGAKVTVDVRD